MTLTIPCAPERLVLPVERGWDGAPCSAPHLQGRVELAAQGDCLELVASLPHQPEPRIPAAPAGARVADLFEYDVVECFLAGSSGSYLEVELGAGGHFLVLSFSAPRVLRDAHETLALPIDHTSDGRAWRTRTRLPGSIVPPDLAALNAFVIASGEHLAFAPLPGSAPDFHRPAEFPRAGLDEPPRLSDPVE